ncbi:MAG: leucine-rich repeat domain-containing protein [Holosporales bacterium]|nr:leucine-rich repeat domain-containing protein [Holosporales bacterium]
MKNVIITTAAIALLVPEIADCMRSRPMKAQTQFTTEDQIIYNGRIAMVARCSSDRPFLREKHVYAGAVLPLQHVKVVSSLANPGGRIYIPSAFTFSNRICPQSVYVPGSVKRFSDQCFRGCGNLSVVAFASNSQLAGIGDEAFRGCLSLLSIRIPASVTQIGNACFDGCGNLSVVAFAPNSQLREIGASAFNRCFHLASIYIPRNLERIGMWCFCKCIELADVTFESGSRARIIDSEAFIDCSDLLSIRIPASVTQIGNKCFNGCIRLDSVAFEPNSRLQYVQRNAFPTKTTVTGCPIGY